MGHSELILQAVTLGRFDEAIAVAREVDPMRGEVRGWVSFWSALAMAHFALGDLQGSLETALRAREAMGPLRHEPLHLELRARAALGDLTGVDALVQEALRGHPRPAFFLVDAADLLRLHGNGEEGMRRYREAVALARAEQEQDPDPDRDWVLAEALLALAAGSKHQAGGAALGGHRDGTEDPGDGPANGRVPGEAEAAALEARDLFHALLDLNPHFFDPPTGLGRAAALLGDTAEARRWSDHLAGLDPRAGHVHLRRARIASLLGDVEGMVAALELAYRGGYRTQFAFRDDPDMMRHGHHPAMAALLRPRQRPPAGVPPGSACGGSRTGFRPSTMGSAGLFSARTYTLPANEG